MSNLSTTEKEELIENIIFLLEEYTDDIVENERRYGGFTFQIHHKGIILEITISHCLEYIDFHFTKGIFSDSIRISKGYKNYNRIINFFQEKYTFNAQDIYSSFMNEITLLKRSKIETIEMNLETSFP